MKTYILVLILANYPLLANFQKGIFDFRKETKGIYPLNGLWEVYPFQWIFPEDKDKGEAIKVPSGWHDSRADLFPTNDGFATYRAKVLFPEKEIGKLYALRLNQIASAYKLFLNRKLVLEVGQIAQSQDKSVPKYQRLILPFVLTQAEVELIFHVSNFEEGNVGGIWQSIEIGPYPLLNLIYLRNLIYESLVAGFLLSMVLYHLILYISYRNRSFYLSFALFCLIIAIRSLITGEKILVKLVPLPFDQEIQLEYLTLFLGPIFLSWYFRDTYPNDVRKSYLIIVTALCLIFVMFSLILPTRLYTLFLPVFQLFLIIAIAFLSLLLGRIIKRKRHGSRAFSFSFLLLLLAALGDIISNRSGYGIYFFPLGLCLFVLFHAYFTSRIMAQREL